MIVNLIQFEKEKEEIVLIDVVDKFTDKMVSFHKHLMEKAMREELAIASKNAGINAPVQIIGEDKIAEIRVVAKN